MKTEFSSILSRLRRLCASYDRMGNASLIVDFHRTDRWYASAERAIESSFVPAASNGLVRTALCRCLTCYFYPTPAEPGDDWYAYLLSTADAWVASLAPNGHWEGLPLAEALERIEVLNRISYMQLDHSRDEDIRRAYDCYARQVTRLSHPAISILKRWHLLCAEGNAIPLTSQVNMESA